MLNGLSSQLIFFSSYKLWLIIKKTFFCSYIGTKVLSAWKESVTSFLPNKSSVEADSHAYKQVHCT